MTTPSTGKTRGQIASMAQRVPAVVGTGADSSKRMRAYLTFLSRVGRAPTQSQLEEELPWHGYEKRRAASQKVSQLDVPTMTAIMSYEPEREGDERLAEWLSANPSKGLPPAKGGGAEDVVKQTFYGGIWRF